ncbi:hypothetical protein TomTYG75_30560 [Sphingobium sp. TomTYG75]
MIELLLHACLLAALHRRRPPTLTKSSPQTPQRTRPLRKIGSSLGASKWISDEAEVHVPSRAGFRLASFDPVPELLIDDAQIWFLAHNPFAFRIEARAA